MFTFSPLLGAQSEATASQSLLELDGGVKVLIDVGWDESFDAERLEELIKCVVARSKLLSKLAAAACSQSQILADLSLRVAA